MVKRLDRVGGSDGALKGGSERDWKRTPRRRLGMLSRSRYSGDGHAWNSMSDMQLGSLWGGFAKGGGVRTNPPNPPARGYGPAVMSTFPCQSLLVMCFILEPEPCKQP